MKRLVVGNWKMNLGVGDAVALTRQVSTAAKGLKRTEAWVAPSFTSLSEVAQCASGTAVRVGAQNVHWEAKGAFTGEVSVPMVREVGCSFVIVGHSERRRVFFEPEGMVAKRSWAALSAGLTTIVCVGETLEEREKGRTNGVIETQLLPCISSLTSDMVSQLVIAYEPVWAIGTGKVASVSDIKDAHAYIAQLWSSVHKAIACPAILYGGSVTPENFAEILKVPLVNGGLVGGASLKSESFGQLLQIAEG